MARQYSVTRTASGGIKRGKKRYANHHESGLFGVKKGQFDNRYRSKKGDRVRIQYGEQLVYDSKRKKAITVRKHRSYF